MLYEEKKMGVEDLRLIFGGFVKAMEDAAEYLINPGQFIMSPEYIIQILKKDRFNSSMMPGYEKDIKEQFQLTDRIYSAENRPSGSGCGNPWIWSI